jgi:hypothetical protein
MRPVLSETYLLDLYWGLGYSLRDISRISGYHGTIVRKAMDRLGIPRRAPHGAPVRGSRPMMKTLVVRDPVLADKLGLEVTA